MSPARIVTQARLSSALAELSVEQRAVFLAVVGGESYAGIAERTGTSVDEVEHRFASALARLDQALDARACPSWWYKLLALFGPLG